MREWVTSAFVHFSYFKMIRIVFDSRECMLDSYVRSRGLFCALARRCCVHVYDGTVYDGTVYMMGLCI